jgi:hypothetical protein
MTTDNSCLSLLLWLRRALLTTHTFNQPHSPYTHKKHLLFNTISGTPRLSTRIHYRTGLTLVLRLCESRLAASQCSLFGEVPVVELRPL